MKRFCKVLAGVMLLSSFNLSVFGEDSTETKTKINANEKEIIALENERGPVQVIKRITGEGFIFTHREGRLMDNILFEKELSENQNFDFKLYEGSKKIYLRDVMMIEGKEKRVYFHMRESLSPDKEYKLIVPAGNVRFKDGTVYEKEINIDFKVPDLELNYLMAQNLEKQKGIRIVFNKSIKNLNGEGVTVKDKDGKEVKVIMVHRMSYIENEVWVKTEELVEGEEYTLHVPANAVETIFGEKYSEEINEVIVAE